MSVCGGCLGSTRMAECLHHAILDDKPGVALPAGIADQSMQDVLCHSVQLLNAFHVVETTECADQGSNTFRVRKVAHLHLLEYLLVDARCLILARGTSDREQLVSEVGVDHLNRRERER